MNEICKNMVKILHILFIDLSHTHYNLSIHFTIVRREHNQRSMLFLAFNNKNCSNSKNLTTNMMTQILFVAFIFIQNHIYLFRKCPNSNNHQS